MNKDIENLTSHQLNDCISCEEFNRKRDEEWEKRKSLLPEFEMLKNYREKLEFKNKYPNLFDPMAGSYKWYKPSYNPKTFPYEPSKSEIKAYREQISLQSLSPLNNTTLKILFPSERIISKRKRLKEKNPSSPDDQYMYLYYPPKDTIIKRLKEKALEKYKRENEVGYDFLPDKNNKEEVKLYNKWFIKKSKEHLLKGGVFNNPPFTTLASLKADYYERLKEAPLKEKYLSSEIDRINNIFSHSSYYNSTFQDIYKKRINGRKRDLSLTVYTDDIWKELYVEPYVEYYILLLQKKEKSQSAAIDKKKGPIKRDHTFLELFRNNEDHMNGFIMLMKTHQYLDKNGKWNKKLARGGKIRPIIKCLESEGIIIKIDSYEEVGRIFNDQFGDILAPRNYHWQGNGDTIDSIFRERLINLKKPKI